MLNKSFCILPFIHLHVNEGDDIKPCCFGNNVKKFTPEFNFATDPDFTKIRNDMLASVPVDQCQNCYKIEELGGKSFRQRDTNEWFDKLGITSPQEAQVDLIYYDIRNDNTCNLSCRICHPGASSQLEKEYKSLGWPITAAGRVTELSKIVNYNTIQRLYVAGGEPTIMPEFTLFLEQAIVHNRTDCELRIITNGTNINKNITELLTQFKNIEFTVSIDGVDQVNRYIRWPSNWVSLVKNIHRLYELTDQISFNVTVSIWNMHRLSDLIFFLESEYNCPLIMLNEAVNSRADADITPWNFPDHNMAIGDLTKLRFSQSYAIDPSFADRVEYFIDRLQKTTFDSEKLEGFFKYNDALDLSRKIQLKDFLPEIENFRKYTRLTK
jgi:sulfatase maturation enzyme AslB (radical SAM superfamily)